jgi:DNA-binding SARP family transcriptional activator/streptogramin lyase
MEKPRQADRPFSTQESPYTFGLLGPLEVWAHGRKVELGGHKHRLLLALLLVHVGEVVSRDRLIEELWHNPPKTAISSLQNSVSELRRALGADLVVTRPAGYSLEVERECVDVHRFELLVARARASGSFERRSELFREALALWRGPPLADFAYEGFASVEIVRLDELRTAAREEFIDVELELGHGSQLVSELEALVAENPLRERLRAQLMLALYRSGRQSEALVVYQEARRTLTDELGLEPGEELQQLERAILVHDPALRPDSLSQPALTSEAAATPPVADVPPQVTGTPVRIQRSRAAPVLLLALVGALVLAAVGGIVFAFSDGSGSEGGVKVVPNSIAVIDSATSRIVDDLEVGGRPVAMTFGEDALWVVTAEDVSRIDPKTRNADTIRVGKDIRDVATGFGSVWLAGGGDGRVIRVDPGLKKPETLHFVEAREMGSAPVRWIAAGAGAVWATRGTTLLEIDPATNELVTKTTIPTPTGLAAGFGAAWVTTDDRRLLRIAPGTAVSPKVSEEVDFEADALSPIVGAGSIWVIVHEETGEIWRIDPATNLTNITRRAGRFPFDLALSERGDTFWAVDLTGAAIHVNPSIDLTVARVAIRTEPTIPGRSALAVGGGRVWVAVQY